MPSLYKILLVQVDVIPFLSVDFNTIFPVFIAVIAVLTLIDIWGFVMRCLSMKRFVYQKDEEKQNEDYKDLIEEGKNLCQQELKKDKRK